MNLLHRLSGLVMRLASVTAPAERAEWMSAMVGEFEALDQDFRALCWAASCLGLAVVWRIRDEATYLSVLVVVVVVWPKVSGTILHFIHPTPHHIRLWMYAVMALEMTVPCLLITAYQPGRGIFTAITMAWLSPGSLFFLRAVATRLLSSPFSGADQNHPHLPNLAFIFLFMAWMLIPCAIGSGLGWAVGRLARIRRA